MKIYNKRGFFSGLFYLSLSVLFLILTVYQGMNLRDWLLIVIWLVLGIGYITRSLSKNASMADRDELSEHLRMKSQAMAFFWSKVVCIGFMVFFAMLASHTKHTLHIALFIAFGLMLIGMIIVGGITEIICNHKVD